MRVGGAQPTDPFAVAYITSLYAGLIGLFVTTLLQIFLPFNRTLDLVVAAFSALLFAGYTVYDTQQVMLHLSVEEYILGAIQLYIDFINLFLSILRILNDLNRD